MPNKQIELDGQLLKKIAHKNATATVTATDLATRERIRVYSDIGRTRSRLIRQGAKIVDNDYMQFWEDLEKAGVGSIVRGRKDKADRFAWHYSLKDVSKSMLDGSDFKSSAPVEKVETKETGKSAHEKFTQKVTCVLGTDRVIELKMPDHFTKDEAEAVCTAIRSLAQ